MINFIILLGSCCEDCIECDPKWETPEYKLRVMMFLENRITIWEKDEYSILYGFFSDAFYEDQWINPGDLVIGNVIYQYDSTEGTAPYLTWSDRDNIESLKEIYGTTALIGVTGNPENGIPEYYREIFIPEEIEIIEPEPRSEVNIEDGLTVKWIPSTKNGLINQIDLYSSETQLIYTAMVPDSLGIYSFPRWIIEDPDNPHRYVCLVRGPREIGQDKSYVFDLTFCSVFFCYYYIKH